MQINSLLNEYIQVAQISLLIIIILLLWRANTSLRIPALYFVILGFCINFLYILSSIIANSIALLHEPLSKMSSAKSDWFSHASIILDLATSVFFYFAAIKWTYEGVIRKTLGGKTRLGTFILWGVVLAIGIGLAMYIKIRKFDIDTQPTTTFVFVFDFVALAWFTVLFARKNSKYFKQNILVVGFGLWALLQFLPFMSMSSVLVNVIGFAGSLVAKILILVGIFSWHLKYSNETERNDERVQFGLRSKNKDQFAQDILSSLLHETLTPLELACIAMEKLVVSNDKDSKYLPYKELESNFERVKAKFDIARDSLNNKKAKGKSGNFKKQREVEGVNKILESTIKEFRLLYPEILFKIEFGANCYIYCLESDMSGIFLNLFKNARESYSLIEKEDWKHLHNTITVRTYVTRPSKDNHERKVVIEVEDYATGINADFHQKVWERGFSTKDNSKKDRGYGLYIIRDILKGYPESEIYFESPFTFKNQTQKISGCKFFLLFNYEI